MRKATVWVRSLAVMMTVFLASAAMAETIQVDVGVPADVLEDYEKLIGNRDPADIRDYSGEGSRRDVVEVILMMQAIERANVDIEISFVPMNTSADILEAIRSGDVIASATSSWKEDLSTHWTDLYITTALVPRGLFEAGFYTSPSNERALSVNSVEDVLSMSVISSREWTADWATLSNLDVAALYDTPEWGDMVDRVTNQEVDYLLAPYQATENMEMLDGEGNVMLVPVRDFKIGLAGSRHMAVSRAHEHGEIFNAALHLGLLLLKEEGIVEKAYRDSGFYNARVANWTTIQAEGAL